MLEKMESVLTFGRMLVNGDISAEDEKQQMTRLLELMRRSIKWKESYLRSDVVLRQRSQQRDDKEESRSLDEHYIPCRLARICQAISRCGTIETKKRSWI